MYGPSWDPIHNYQSPHKLPALVYKQTGCYHMKYYLSGKLIAVSVIDILDNGLSSTYFFYNPSLKHYRLGVVSTLIEI